LADIYLSKCTIPEAYFIKSKAENQLKFQQHSAPAQCVGTTIQAALLGDAVPDFIITANLWLTRLQSCWLQILGNATGVRLSISYASIGWSNVWLTDRRSLIKRLIGGDLGW